MTSVARHRVGRGEGLHFSCEACNLGVFWDHLDEIFKLLSSLFLDSLCDLDCLKTVACDLFHLFLFHASRCQGRSTDPHAAWGDSTKDKLETEGHLRLVADD